MPECARILPVLAIAFALSASAQPPTVDSAASVVTLTATVEAIDYASRIVAVKGPLGRTVALRVDDQVRNLGKVKPGDEIVLNYTEAMLVALAQRGGARREAPAAAAPAPVPAATKPDVASAQPTRIVARIGALDVARQVMLLEGSGARYVEVRLKDGDLFRGLKVGDDVEATYTDALVLRIVTHDK